MKGANRCNRRAASKPMAPMFASGRASTTRMVDTAVPESLNALPTPASVARKRVSARSMRTWPAGIDLSVGPLTPLASPITPENAAATSSAQSPSMRETTACFRPSRETSKAWVTPVVSSTNSSSSRDICP
jgi:hypothetical protein